jgi:hypothetical protein
MRSIRIMSLSALVAGLACVALLSAPPAAARVFVGVGIGVPLYAPYPPPVYYPPPAYYAPPPPVYYTPPPPAYMTPPPQTYAPPPLGAPPPGYAPPPGAPPPGAGPASANCREYSSRTTIAGQDQEIHGTACQQPDGTWKIMN